MNTGASIGSGSAIVPNKYSVQGLTLHSNNR